jgi:hypothetical protein
VDVRALLADVATIGPFFVIRTEPSDQVDAGWRPLADLHTDPAPLRDRIAHARSVLDCDDRVAASIAFQGLAAVLVSAPFAAVAVHGIVPALTPARLRWQPTVSGPLPLWCPEPAGRAVAAGAAPDALATLLDGLLAPLVSAVRAQVPVAERLLRGNAASAVASAKRLVGTARPAAADGAARLAEGVLATGPFAGAGDLLAPSPPDVGWSFRRRTCCLYYKAPGGGLCEDCVLHARGTSR